MLDNPTLVAILWTVLGAFATAFLGLIVWGIKKLITTTFNNTIAVTLLNSHIEELLKLPPKVEKLQADMNEAHRRIKHFNKKGELT